MMAGHREQARDVLAQPAPLNQPLQSRPGALDLPCLGRQPDPRHDLLGCGPAPARPPRPPGCPGTPAAPPIPSRAANSAQSAPRSPAARLRNRQRPSRRRATDSWPAGASGIISLTTVSRVIRSRSRPSRAFSSLADTAASSASGSFTRTRERPREIPVPRTANPSATLLHLHGRDEEPRVQPRAVFSQLNPSLEKGCTRPKLQQMNPANLCGHSASSGSPGSPG